MKAIGITGSIGSGKSTTLGMFRDLGINCWDADAAVHELYKKSGAAYKILGNEFGKIIQGENEINRPELSKIVLNNNDALKRLEAIVHPLVSDNRNEFIGAHRIKNPPYILLDIPLLFETELQEHFDAVIVVACSFETQKSRVLARKNMTEEKFLSIYNKQMATEHKIKLADFVINTDTNLEDARNQVNRIDKALRG